MNKKRLEIIFYSLIVLVIVSSALAGWFYYKYHQVLGNGGVFQGTNEQQVAKLISDVGKLVELPKDEIPTVATVSNPDKLKDQAFFAGAKQGDKVLIYTKAQKAVLYRPGENKILGIAPLNITGTTSSQTR